MTNEELGKLKKKWSDRGVTTGETDDVIALIDSLEESRRESLLHQEALTIEVDAHAATKAEAEQVRRELIALLDRAETWIDANPPLDRWAANGHPGEERKELLADIRARGNKP